nr:VOC family protein [Streptomyces sp. DSM 41633]
LGARILHAVDEPGGSWLVLTDPEGNEFCVS